MPVDYQTHSTAHLGFRFVVAVEGERQAAFTECSLPVIDWEIEEVKEGGLNTYVHRLPGRRRAATLTLKNGVGKGQLVEWYLKTMKEEFERKSITVSLLDSEGGEVVRWNISEVLPSKWTGPQLRAGDNTVAIQTLELSCGQITIETI